MKIKSKLTACTLCIIMLGCFTVATAQTKDTIAPKEKSHPNVIKFNISAPLVYNSSIMGSYERVLSPNRSFTIYGGYCEMPAPNIIADNSNLKIINNKQKSGFAIGADYRFYLASENKYAAPRGLYLAPFVSYYSFTNTRNIQYTGGTDPQMLTGKFGASFFNAGACLGYQFVIKNRFVLDMVMFGPSWTGYRFSVKLDGNINPDDLTQAQKDLINALKDKFPFLNTISDNKEVSTSGVSTFGAVGFRYSMSIGYRF